MMPTKNSYCFQCKGRIVKFSSNFDSGNLRTVKQLSEQSFLVESSLDSYDVQVSRKSFFHFSVQNYPLQAKINLQIPSLALLQTFLGADGKEEQQSNFKKYRPWISLNGKDYQRLKQENVSFEFQKYCNEYPVLKICYQVQSSIVYFSFAVPYSYQRYLDMVRDLQQSEQFYLRKQVLCYSLNLNLVYMLTITSFDKITDEQQNIGAATNSVLFPEKHIQDKGKYFQKPVVLISGRVHPGQTPSSWAIEGIIKFLISNQEKAKLLRKNFIFVIVPMLNPDGVYEGMYRLDTKGHNLNRYYEISDNRQPSIYGMKHLMNHFKTTKRLLYFLDFHGHPSLKGSFLYGNAHQDIAYQAQTQLFARVMSLKCQTFQQRFCIFDRQQMKSKDRYDFFTKQGCARVYAFKTAKILHSYTIEMGFHSVNKFSSLNNPQNFLYIQQDYIRQGVSFLEAVLQTSGITKQLSIASLRKKIIAQIDFRDDRFRKQAKNINLKKKNVNQIIEVEYWKAIKDRFFKDKKQREQQTLTRNRNVYGIKTFYSKSLNPEDQIVNQVSLQKQMKIIEKYNQNERNCIQSMVKKQVKKYHKSTLQFCFDNANKIDNKNVTFNVRNRNFSDKRFSEERDKRKVYFNIINRQQDTRISGIKQIKIAQKRQRQSKLKFIDNIASDPPRIKIQKNQLISNTKKVVPSIDRNQVTKKEQQSLFADTKLRQQDKYATMQNEDGTKFIIFSDSKIELFRSQHRRNFHLGNKRSSKIRNPFQNLK